MQEGEKHLRFFKKSFGRLTDFRHMYSESKTLPPANIFPKKYLTGGGRVLYNSKEGKERNG